jgi:molecular chaperone HtpG
MTTATHKETLGFQTEVRQLLDLVIHSLYSNKEIFLRELISNASDAADKLRFEALTDDALYEGEGELKVWVSYDKDARTITVRDNGIGMSRQEVVDNIGTIARSGTRQFFQNLTGDQAKDSQLIGQFGVGFYSAFIVADRVTLTTRRAGLGAEHGVRWESGGEGEYSLETVERKERGTEVVLHLRPDEDEFLDGWRLRGIVRKFSDHIALPILMPKEGEQKGEWEPVNEATALWARPKAEVTDEQYRELYRHVSHDFGEPLAWTHNRVEGAQDYVSLLYIPSRAPFDLWDRRERHGVKLYVRRVFIMDDAEQLMPPYLRFVRGVIDSADLPLNISREILQESRQVEAMRSGSVKKVLGLLEHLAKDEPEKYTTFWREFGRVLKEGVIDDYANRDRIAKLLRFASTHGSDATPSVSFEDYVARMKEGQEAVYYVTADSWGAARHSPHLEVFAQKGVEVLVMTDGIDEWVVSHLSEFDGKPLRSVAKGALDLGKLDDAQAKAEAEKAAEALKPLAGRIKEALGDRVKEVRVTHRLTTSPACLVAGEHDMGRHMERVLRATGQTFSVSKPVLEINPEHPLIRRMEAEADGARLADWAELLFGQALLAEGGQLEEPGAFVQRLNRMLLELSGGPGAPAG